MKLIRDFSTTKDKGQEERFRETENTSLFFDTEKVIPGFDQWTLSAAMKLINEAPENIVIYFSKWNKNLEEIYAKRNIKIESTDSDLDNVFISYLKTGDILKLRALTKELDANQQVIALFICLSFLEDNKLENINLINKAINTNSMSVKHLLELFIIKIVGEKINEA